MLPHLCVGLWGGCVRGSERKGRAWRRWRDGEMEACVCVGGGGGRGVSRGGSYSRGSPKFKLMGGGGSIMRAWPKVCGVLLEASLISTRPPPPSQSPVSTTISIKWVPNYSTTLPLYFKLFPLCTGTEQEIFYQKTSFGGGGFDDWKKSVLLGHRST